MKCFDLFQLAWRILKHRFAGLDECNNCCFSGIYKTIKKHLEDYEHCQHPMLNTVYLVSMLREKRPGR